MNSPIYTGKKILREKRQQLLKKGLALAAAAGAGALTVTCSLTQAMADAGMNRRMPVCGKFINVSGGKPDKDFALRRQEAAKALKDQPSEEFTLTSFDGLALKAHLVASDSPKRLVIAFHGWRSTWNRDFCMVAPFWRESGCNVLYVEQRGQGESEGKYMGFGLLERKDCQAWAAWAARQWPDLPIYLSGISMGATTVLMAAGEALPKNVKGITADCGFTSPKAIWRHVTEQNLHMSYSPIRRLWLDGAFRRKLHAGLGSYSTLTAMKACRTPVLFVHGTADAFVPIEMTYENYLACAAPHRLVVIPGAGHGMSYALEPETCRRAMESFWDEFDQT